MSPEKRVIQVGDRVRVLVPHRGVPTIIDTQVANSASDDDDNDDDDIFDATIICVHPMPSAVDANNFVQTTIDEMERRFPGFVALQQSLREFYIQETEPVRALPEQHVYCVHLDDCEEMSGLRDATCWFCASHAHVLLCPPPNHNIRDPQHHALLENAGYACTFAAVAAQVGIN